MAKPPDPTENDSEFPKSKTQITIKGEDPEKNYILSGIIAESLLFL